MNNYFEYEREQEETFKKCRMEMRILEADRDGELYINYTFDHQEVNETTPYENNFDANYWIEDDNNNEEESYDAVEPTNETEYNFEEYDNETNVKESVTSQSETNVITSQSDEILSTYQLQFSMNNTSMYKKTFNIADNIEALLNSILLYSPPIDNNGKINKHFDRSIGETMRYLYQISTFHNFSQSARSDILKWFNFATSCSDDTNLTSKIHNNEIGKYQPPLMLLKYDICPAHGCEVFVGESARNFQCSECKDFRYKACNNPICIKNKKESSCYHLRPALKQIYYRPLIGYISKLLVHDLFINMIKFQYVKKNPFEKVDILEGTSAEKNMNEMKMKYSNLGNKDSYIPVNLLFSMFFDGVQIYKSKASVFWPLFITILNLPPSFRSTPHAGIFLSSIFTCKLGSNAEKFLMYECLLNELLLLYEGIFITINDKKYFVQARLISHVFDTKGLEKIMDFANTTNSFYGSPLAYNGVRGIYFRDLRKVSFINDLRMYSDINHITRKVGQSMKCCPYQSGGALLTENDYYIGEDTIIKADKSNRLDPNNIDNEDQDYIYNKKEIITSNINKSKRKSNYISNKNQKQITQHKDLPSRLCFLHDIDNKILTNLSTIQQLKEFKNDLKLSIKDDTNFFVWHHFRHDKQNKICDNLYFSHCCYKYRPYVRINQNDYKDAVRASSKTNNNSESSDDESASTMASSKIEENYNDTFTRGIKGGNSFFNNLPYANIETDLHWDVMHLIKNISVHLLDLISGNRLKDKMKIRKHCEKTGCHKSYSETGIEPWVISESNKCRVDVFLSSILIPKGYSDKFQIRTVFKRSSFINSNGHLCIIRSLLNLIGFIGKLPYVYQEFLSMVQYDFNEILRPKFAENYDYKYLFKLLNETAICKAGLFPASEIFFEWLQILDIPHSIKVNGPVRGYWAFTGERFNNEVMNYTKIGGYNSELTTIKSNSAIADEYLQNLYKQNLEDISIKKIEMKGLNTKKLFDINHTEIKDSRVYYNDEKTRLYNHGNNKTAKLLKLNKFECEVLLKSIIYDNFDILMVSHISSINTTLIQSSWLYRISLSFQIYHIKTNKKMKKEFRCTTFLSFLKRLEELAPKNVFGINSSNNINFNKGEIKIEDYATVYSFLNNNTIEINNNALIKGTLFSSQGETYRQQIHSTLSSPSSNCENLKLSWYSKASYSSWFKFNKDLYETYKELYLSEEFGNYFINGHFYCDIYGQFNFFFELNKYEDSLIASNKYASVTVRKTIDYNQEFYEDKRDGLHHLPVIELDKAKTKRNYIHNLIFVSEKLIHSSPVFILPIQVANHTFTMLKAIKPKIVKKEENESFWNVNNYKNYYSKDLNAATHLFMIDIERNRMNSDVTYVESDDYYNKN